jgi:hypothetical protein
MPKSLPSEMTAPKKGKWQEMGGGVEGRTLVGVFEGFHKFDFRKLFDVGLNCGFCFWSLRI